MNWKFCVETAPGIAYTKSSPPPGRRGLSREAGENDVRCIRKVECRPQPWCSTDKAFGLSFSKNGLFLWGWLGNLCPRTGSEEFDRVKLFGPCMRAVSGLARRKIKALSVG